ncbi:MAG: leucine-rich repeat protein [Prevotella sp.]|nr:leucine-rich repeat protein [Prevotella sp.]
MKTIRTTMILAFLLSVLGIKATSTFTYQVNGVNMTFSTLDKDPLNVFVNTALIGDGVNTCISQSYSGTLELPFNAYNSNDGKWYTVRGINNNAFKNCIDLNGITFSRYMFIIGDYAFQGCSSLYNITIPTFDTVNHDYSNITTIGEGAFSGCSHLQTVDLGSSVKTIGSLAFRNCTYMTSVNIDNLETWCNIEFGNESANPARYAFTSTDGGGAYPKLYVGGTELKNLVIPNTVTAIKDYAFVNYRTLSSVTIPTSVNSIGKNAFNNCEGLETVSGAQGVSDVGANAFLDTKWYNYQTDGLIYIGKCLYKYKGTMPARTKIVVADGTKSIGYDAFKDCVGLETLAVPASLEKIGYVALDGCEYLTDFYCLIQDPEVLDYNFVFPSPGNVTLHVPEASMRAYQEYRLWLECKDIVPFVEYNLKVAETKVNELNADDVLGDRKVSFDASNGNVLSLKNATISVNGTDKFGIYNQLDDLVINVTGQNNTISSTNHTGLFSNRNVTITGGGKLSIQGKTGVSLGVPSARPLVFTVTGGTTTNIEGDISGIQGSTNRRQTVFYDDIVVEGNNTIVRVKGGSSCCVYINNLTGKITAPSGIQFNNTKKAVTDANGTIVSGVWVTIEKFVAGISTDINAIDNEELTIDSSLPLYNLHGQRVSHPVKGQIYIQNGRKVKF